uniref:Uncharacterized protein n=1 Tax=Glossina palpalis gambiensis TaxID=67801 RepID=A0A1B0BZL3_9MUSC
MNFCINLCTKTKRDSSLCILGKRHDVFFNYNDDKARHRSTSWHPRNPKIFNIRGPLNQYENGEAVHTCPPHRISNDNESHNDLLSRYGHEDDHEFKQSYTFKNNLKYSSPVKSYSPH